MQCRSSVQENILEIRIAIVCVVTPWDVLDHPPYSPDLAPSECHLFLRLKKHLAGKKFDDVDEVQEVLMTWFKQQAAEFYDSGIQKLVPILNKFDILLAVYHYVSQ
jgi:hypothetical protein